MQRLAQRTSFHPQPFLRSFEFIREVLTLDTRVVFLTELSLGALDLGIRHRHLLRVMRVFPLQSLVSLLLVLKQGG